MNQAAHIIESISGIRCEHNVSARKLTSYAVGGNIRFLITLDDEKSIPLLFKALNQLEVPYIFLGAGTNLLVSDSGFNGAFVRLGESFKTVKLRSESIVHAGGACLISDFIAFLRMNNLGGPVFLSGIPGTIGGAIAMNAGAFGGEIANHVIYARVINKNYEIVNLSADECQFGYRESGILREQMMVLGAEIAVIPNVRIDEQIDEFIQRRMKNHIPHSHYAGSVFKNPIGGYAGKLIEDSGLKGLRIGTAYISDKHANFIIADDGGYASDVIELMRIAALRVYDYFGVKLFPEIRLVGFDIDWDEIFES